MSPGMSEVMNCGTDSPSRPSEGTHPANPGISDFWPPPELGHNTVLLRPLAGGVFGWGSPRKPAHFPGPGITGHQVVSCPP